MKREKERERIKGKRELEKKVTEGILCKKRFII
jgi:hypothetical protein